MLNTLKISFFTDTFVLAKSLALASLLICISVERLVGKIGD